MLLAKMTHTNKRINPQHLQSDTANVQIWINPEIWIQIPDHILRLVECALSECSCVLHILQVEVFNVLFTVSGGAGHERKYFVHCMDCALSISPALTKVVVLQQYDMSRLVDVYNSLQS